MRAYALRLRILSVVIFSVVLVSLAPPRVLACALAFDQVTALHAEILQQFRDGKYQPSTFVVLPSSNGSFRVDVGAGAVVVRLESDANDLAFEEFATGFFADAGLLTAQILRSKLPEDLSQRLSSHLALFSDSSIQEEFAANRTPEVSVATFFDEPFMLGVTFLNQFDSYRQAAAEDPAARAEQWRRLDKRLQANLADHWAAHVVLGISDMHPSNWLIGPRSQVASIDLAMRSVIFERGMEKVHWLTLLSPMGPGNITAAHFQELVAAISPAMHSYLADLDRDQMLAIAKRSGFPLTTPQINGALARARLLRP